MHGKPFHCPQGCSSRSVTQDPELTRVAAGSGEDAFSLQAF